MMIVLARIDRASGVSPVRQNDGCGEATDFGRVDARGDEDDILPLVEQSLTLAGGLQPRIHELALDLPVVLEVGECCRVADERDEEGAAEGGLA
jgi:hypothetical protein